MATQGLERRRNLSLSEWNEFSYRPPFAMTQPKKRAPNFVVTPKVKDLPTTQGMLGFVRDELRSEILKLDHKLNSVELGLNSKIMAVDSKIAGMGSKVEGLASQMKGMDATLTRMATLMEEQDFRNRIVLERLADLFHRQDRVEKRVDDTETTIRRPGQAKSSDHA